jgi:hypothetical protein
MTTPKQDGVAKELKPCTCCVHKFQSPKNCLILGNTSCGKTALVKQLILNRTHCFETVPVEVIYIYTVYQEAYEELQQALGKAITFRTDIPDKSQLMSLYNEKPCHRLLVFDDKMTSLRENKQGRNILDILSVLSHHCNYTCMVLSQNYFHSSLQKAIGLQSQYLVLFANPRSQQQVRTLGTQMFAGQLDYFMDAFEKATSVKHGYLLVDLCQGTDQKPRLKSCILPNEMPKVYVPL